MSFARFCIDDTGAVAVDWTVLTGGLVGLGLVTASLVGVGVETAADTTATDIRSASFAARFRAGLREDFDTGAENWTGGTVVDIPGFGEALLMAPGEVVQTSFAFDGAGAAVLEFDMMYLDTWDNETATVWVDGQAVGAGTLIHTDHTEFNNGNTPPSFNDLGVEGVRVEVIETADPIDGGYQGYALDHRQRLRITVDEPGDRVDLGFTNDLDQDVHDEALAVDNLRLSSGY